MLPHAPITRFFPSAGNQRLLTRKARPGSPLDREREGAEGQLNPVCFSHSCAEWGGVDNKGPEGQKRRGIYPHMEYKWSNPLPRDSRGAPRVAPRNENWGGGVLFPQRESSPSPEVGSSFGSPVQLPHPKPCQPPRCLSYLNETHPPAPPRDTCRCAPHLEGPHAAPAHAHSRKTSRGPHPQTHLPPALREVKYQPR